MKKFLKWHWHEGGNVDQSSLKGRKGGQCYVFVTVKSRSAGVLWTSQKVKFFRGWRWKEASRELPGEEGVG